MQKFIRDYLLEFKTNEDLIKYVKEHEEALKNVEHITYEEKGHWCLLIREIIETDYYELIEKKNKIKRTKQKYKAKCTKKYVEFYIKDKAILQLARKINFQAFVKQALRLELERLKEGVNDGK